MWRWRRASPRQPESAPARSLRSGLCCPRRGSFPSPLLRGKCGSKTPTFQPPHTSGTWWAVGASPSPRGVRLPWIHGWFCLPEARAQVYPARPPGSSRSPSLSASGRAVEVRRQPPLPGLGESMSTLHASLPPPWPTASTCFLHMMDMGTVLQEPQFGWGARRASLPPGSLRGPGAGLWACLRLRCHL